MLTDPVEDILPTSIDNKEVEELLDQFANAIREAVNYSTHVFKWCAEIPGDDTFLPVFLSFRHVIGLLDAVSILIKSACVDPCELLLRGVLESSFNILYILQENTNRRAMCFLVWYFNERLKLYEIVDPTTPSGRQFQTAIRKDRLVGQMKITEFDNLAERKDNLKRLLNKPLYRDIEEEYQKSRGCVKHWYSLFGGPKTLEQLANELELSGLYNVLYRSWSGAAHGVEIIEGKVSSAETGETLITQIRNIEGAQRVTSISLSLIIEILKNIIGHYRPDKNSDVGQWYFLKLRDFYHKISSGKQLIAVK